MGGESIFGSKVTELVLFCLRVNERNGMNKHDHNQYKYFNTLIHSSVECDQGVNIRKMPLLEVTAF